MYRTKNTNVLLTQFKCNQMFEKERCCAPELQIELTIMTTIKLSVGTEMVQIAAISLTIIIVKCDKGNFINYSSDQGEGQQR